MARSAMAAHGILKTRQEGTRLISVSALKVAVNGLTIGHEKVV